MECITPIWLEKLGRFVPCGRCRACRVNYSSMWSTRLMHELASHKNAVFLTLTYSDKNLIFSIDNKRPTLYKRHWQLFMKRLRRYDDQERKFKYYVCGEYGETTGRPHYHAIIFGLSVKECDRALVRKCWKHCDEVGIYFGTVTKDSCRYTADYIMKSAKSKADKEAYYRQCMEPPFCTISNGIGLEFIASHSDEMTKNLSTIGANGERVSLPRYYADKLNIRPGLKGNYFEKFVKKHKSDILKHYPELQVIFDQDYIAGYLGIHLSTKVVSGVQAKLQEYITKYYVPARKAKSKKSIELAERRKKSKTL